MIWFTTEGAPVRARDDDNVVVPDEGVIAATTEGEERVRELGKARVYKYESIAVVNERARNFPAETSVSRMEPGSLAAAASCERASRARRSRSPFWRDEYAFIAILSARWSEFSAKAAASGFTNA